MINQKSQNNTKFEQVYNSLNTNQKLAVDSIEGPVLVVAGPGTGKTQILSARIANILQRADLNPENILCITFTEAGAKEMRERIKRIIGRDAHKITITTFHGFCNEVIQNNPESFSYFREQKQLDPLSQFKSLKLVIDCVSEEYINQNRNLPNLIPFHDKYSKVSDISRAIQTLKKEDYSTNDFMQFASENFEEIEKNPKINKRTNKPTGDYLKDLKKAQVMIELSEIYSKYQTHLSENGFYDFDDMIMNVIQAFECEDGLLAKYQERYLYIHVDEFQDTNGAQSRVVDLLASFDENPNLFVVGDDDQAIYRFQGASLDNIMGFRNKYPSAQIIPIIQNYRSTQNVLNSAMNLIDKNESRLTKLIENLSKELVSNTKDSHSIIIIENSIEEEENLWIANKIQELNKEGVNFNNIAIIYRKNAHAENINNVLNKFNIPTKIDVTQNLFEFNSVKQFVLLLKTISQFDKNRDSNLYGLLMFDFWNIPPVEVYKLNFQARKNKISFEEQCLKMLEENISFDNAELNSTVNKIILWHKNSLTQKLISFLENVIYDSGIIDSILKKDNIKSNDLSEDSIEVMELMAIKQLFKHFTQQVQVKPDVRLVDILIDIELLKQNHIKLSVPKIQIEETAVSLLTAHGSKGMEFDYVFIIKATDGNWESKRAQYEILTEDVFIMNKEIVSNKKDISIEDERRLFYVALTRVKKQAFITYATEYTENGNTKQTNASQFIFEISGERNTDIQIIKNEKADIKQLVDLLKPIRQTTFADNTKLFLKELLKDLTVSASTLNAYLKSPREFLENRILRAPTPKDKYLTMGTSIHWALEKLNKFTMSGHSAEDYSQEKMIKDYTFMLEKEFLGDEDFESTLSEGKKHLSNYYNSIVAKGVYRNAIESEFSFRNVQLQFDPDKDPIILSGRIDKIEAITNEANTTIPVKVIDFKTMAPLSENEIKGDTKNSDGSYARQLVFYKLLGNLDNLFRPHRSFSNPKYDICEVEIAFLKPDQAGKIINRSFEIPNSSVEVLKMLIIEVYQKIMNLDFPEECNSELIELAEKVTL